MKIHQVIIIPVAFADPPLLNVMGVHQPWALRSVLQLVCEDGVVGLGESYGDDNFLTIAYAIAKRLIGVDVFDLPAIRRAVAEETGSRKYQDRHGLTGAFSGDKTMATAYSFFEVAALDAQGQYLGRPISDLLGGASRTEVDFSAYLFYKYGKHTGGEPDSWGEALTPESIVDQARTMIDAYGFSSIKLKGGVFPPEQEIAAIRALHEAFPEHPLRIDPNGAWKPETGIRVAEELSGVLEYLEDPTPGVEAMAEVAERAGMPLATNMCVVRWSDIPEAVSRKAVDVILADHHYWGGLRATAELSRLCETFGLGLSMHSNSHLGISLAAMVHAAACSDRLTYACDTHWPWKDTDVIESGALEFVDGAVKVPTEPGLGVRLDPDALARGAENYRNCGIKHRDDVTYMKTYRADFEPNLSRW